MRSEFIFRTWSLFALHYALCPLLQQTTDNDQLISIMTEHLLCNKKLRLSIPSRSRDGEGGLTFSLCKRDKRSGLISILHVQQGRPTAFSVIRLCQTPTGTLNCYHQRGTAIPTALVHNLLNNQRYIRRRLVRTRFSHFRPRHRKPWHISLSS